MKKTPRIPALGAIVLVALSSVMLRGVRAAPNAPALSIYRWDAMGADRVMPFGDGRLGTEAEALQVRLSPDEYEPVAFAIRATNALEDIRIDIGDLATEQGSSFAHGALEVKLVKAWYQAGSRAVRRSGRRHLMPELLVNDDGLIRVDRAGQHNFIRIEQDGVSRYIRISGPEDAIPLDAYVRDAVRLQPFALERGERREVWVTVHASADTAPGVYGGFVSISATGLEPRRVPLTVEVLPIPLNSPQLRTSLYYRGELIPEGTFVRRNGELRGEPTVRSRRWKSESQYRLELRDLIAHGVDHPTLYNYSWKDRQGIARALRIRKEEGISDDELFLQGIFIGNERTPGARQKMRNRVAGMLEFLEGKGVGSVFFYGIDEAKGEDILAQRESWRQARDLGAKVYTAIHPGSASLTGGDIDLAVVAYEPKIEEALHYHALGVRIYSYADPQVGVENPELYRRNYGLRLWKAGYDGSMTYAYQDGRKARHGDTWNDFDGSTKWRDGVFVYPLDEGIVRTVQWEGFREAVDDLRYLATLVNAIDALPPGGRQRSARVWLEGLDIDRPLGVVRAELVAKILELSGRATGGGG